MSYRRLFELLAGLLLVAGGCTDEFPEQESSLISDDGVYRVTLELSSEDVHAGESVGMELSVEHDGEAIDVEMPELHYEQHPDGSDSGRIDLEAGHMHGGHHAMHTFETAGDYMLTFSFLGSDHHMEDAHDDEDGGEEAADAGAADDHAADERSEHEFIITVREAEDHGHEATHMDDDHAH